MNGFIRYADLRFHLDGTYTINEDAIDRRRSVHARNERRRWRKARDHARIVAEILEIKCPRLPAVLVTEILSFAFEQVTQKEPLVQAQ